MKILTTLIIACLTFGISFSKPATYKFTTLGNCYVCKVRIEEAVNKLDGIDSVNWDYNYDVTMVMFDDEITDLHTIMKTIAMVGHDTEWYPADSAAYAFLIGSCCEYVREIDYSKVQIGYLSWMGIWVSVEDYFNYKFDIFPTLINDGYFNILNESGFNGNLNLKIYNLSGIEIYTNNVLPGTSNLYNISSISTGQYFVIISDEKKNVFTTRIIVQ